MCLCRILHIFHLPECLSRERSQVRWKMQTVWTFLQNAWIGKGDEVERAWLAVVQKCFLLFQTLVSFSFRLLGGGIFGGSERGVFKKNSILTQIRGKKVYRLRKRDSKRYHRTNMQDVREDVLYFKAGLCVQLGGRNSDASHSVWPQASVSMWTCLCSNSVRSAPVLQRIAVSGWRRWVGENISLCLKYVWDTPVQALWMEPKWNFSLS